MMRVGMRRGVAIVLGLTLMGALLGAHSGCGHNPDQRVNMEEASRVIEAKIRAHEQTSLGRVLLRRAFTGRLTRPANGRITSGFGPRYHPILHSKLMHTGVDIRAGYGEAIRAAAGGDVVMAGNMQIYGNVVVIDHGGGVSTVYGHCSELLVSKGQTVRQGQTIARVGATGLATGPHLHYEVRRNGTPVNPLQSRQWIDEGRP